MNSITTITIRRLSANYEADGATWAGIHELCCRTGSNGDPIAPGRWPLFARIWIEPYQKICPEWTYVAESDGSVVGYLTGCPDSQRFYRVKPWRVTFPLLMSIAAGRYCGSPGAGQFVKRTLGLWSFARSRDRLSLPRWTASAYPAHLHINVDARYRRMGVGRKLMKSYFSDLRRQGVCGVHLFCGDGPVGFYRGLGFHVLERAERDGLSIFALALSLQFSKDPPAIS